MALSQLQASQQCEELLFWGKINGLKNDYFIAMALKFVDNYEFPSKTFYWALSNEFEFKELPSLNSQYDSVINADNSYFQGEPARIIIQVKQGEGEEAEGEAKAEDEDEENQEKKAQNSDETEEEEIKVPQRDLTGKW